MLYTYTFHLGFGRVAQVECEPGFDEDTRRCIRTQRVVRAGVHADDSKDLQGGGPGGARATSRA